MEILSASSVDSTEILSQLVPVTTQKGNPQYKNSDPDPDPIKQDASDEEWLEQLRDMECVICGDALSITKDDLDPRLCDNVNQFGEYCSNVYHGHCLDSKFYPKDDSGFWYCPECLGHHKTELLDAQISPFIQRDEETSNQGGKPSDLKLEHSQLLILTPGDTPC